LDSVYALSKQVKALREEKGRGEKRRRSKESPSS